jgi:hypothetical protein
MIICSDGGGKDGKGSVGIVISIKNKIVIRLANRVLEKLYAITRLLLTQ